MTRAIPMGAAATVAVSPRESQSRNSRRGSRAAPPETLIRPRHGGSRDPVYRIWQNIKDRCRNPNNPHFHNYGGRGITLHPEWLKFPAFLAAVGPRPYPSATLERMDNDGSYAPGNVRWATRKEQARNQRKNRLLTVGGETKPLAAWAEDVGLRPSTIHYRLRTGMSDEAAVLTPARGGRRPAL